VSPFDGGGLVGRAKVERVEEQVRHDRVLLRGCVHRYHGGPCREKKKRGREEDDMKEEGGEESEPHLFLVACRTCTGVCSSKSCSM
jgi:hypothetical protein